jgi:hypothetical protein
MEKIKKLPKRFFVDFRLRYPFIFWLLIVSFIVVIFTLVMITIIGIYLLIRKIFGLEKKKKEEREKKERQEQLEKQRQQEEQRKQLILDNIKKQKEQKEKLEKLAKKETEENKRKQMMKAIQDQNEKGKLLEKQRIEKLKKMNKKKNQIEINIEELQDKKNEKEKDYDKELKKIEEEFQEEDDDEELKKIEEKIKKEKDNKNKELEEIEKELEKEEIDEEKLDEQIKKLEKEKYDPSKLITSINPTKLYPKYKKTKRMGAIDFSLYEKKFRKLNKVIDNQKNNINKFNQIINDIGIRLNPNVVTTRQKKYTPDMVKNLYNTINKINNQFKNEKNTAMKYHIDQSNILKKMNEINSRINELKQNITNRRIKQIEPNQKHINYLLSVIEKNKKRIKKSIKEYGKTKDLVKNKKLLENNKGFENQIIKREKEIKAIKNFYKQYNYILKL